MMSLSQFVLCKIAEEATEVGKRALKQQQFGTDQHETGYETNRQRLTNEAEDLRMWLFIAWELDLLGTQTSLNARYQRKRDELLRVLRISVDHGQVNPAALKFFEDKTYLAR